jgi:hypothetical protein
MILSISLIQVQSRKIITKNEENSCYGFIIPLPSGLDTTEETLENNLVRHLINDLLRENITVYWSNKNFTTSVQNFLNENNQEKIFKKGDFIIPFTKNNYLDNLIISIITDYNISSELDQKQKRIEVYKLMTPINLDSYILNETKIIQHLGVANRYGWPAYLLMAESGGFFTTEFMLDGEAEQMLNNKDFNCVTWPYTPDPATLTELFFSFLNKRDYDAIRNFVRKGGGYIGSCEGAFTASSGQPSPLSAFSIQRAYKTNQNSYYAVLSFSISDTLMLKRFVLTDLYKSKSKITDQNHPLAFGLNSTINELFSGPYFVWIGPNSQTNSYYIDLSSTKNNSNNQYLLDRIIGTPNWVTSKFGDGNVILFASHPEFIQNISFLFETFDWQGDKYYGRRIMHNAFFYATSKDLKIINTKIDKAVSEIKNIIQKTKEIEINTISQPFPDLKSKIKEFKNEQSKFYNLSLDLFTEYKAKFENTFFERNFRILKYISAISNIFINYLEKSLKSLDKIEQIYPLLYQYDTIIDNKIKQVEENIYLRLNKSLIILSKIVNLANKAYTKTKESKISIFQKLVLEKNIRKILSDLEINFKYIPQIYFEMIKLVRSNWYNYEGYYSINIK